MKRFLQFSAGAILFFASAFSVQAQAVKSKTDVPNPTAFIKSSPAFAEISLRRAELRAELESLLVTYTEEFPKVKETRFELEVLNRELNRLLTVKPGEAQKLTEALGKIIVRKSEIESDLRRQLQNYGDDHPAVKRARKRVEIFEAAIKEILEAG